MSMLHKMITTTLTLALGMTTVLSLASAGSIEDGKYTSNLGYSFMPPDGWIKYDASTSTMLPGIPTNLKEISFKRFDTVFFQPSKNYSADNLAADTQRVEERKKAIIAGSRPAPGTSDGDALDKSEADARKDALPQSPEFAASIAIMVVQHAPSNTNTDTANMYAEKFKQDIGSFVASNANVVIKKSTSDEIHGKKALLFSMDVKNDSRDLHIDQTVITNQDKSIVVTCISDNNETMPDKNWCMKATNSIHFN